ncbi:MAG: DUF499 domain-containing protein, partial [Desulfomonilaceae bacterium]
ENLITIVGKRLDGAGGDPVVQLKTPFGGGKTHALIALYHQYAAVKPVVMVGTEMGTDTTPWGMLEEQLTGKVERFSGLVSPGGDAIRRLLAQRQPVLILIDELLEYVTKAAGVAVEKSVLSAQVMAFLQEISEVATTLDRVVLMVTLPASVMEHYDEQAERLFTQLQHVTGRVEKIYTPVQEHEIASIIRRRLFSSVDMTKANAVIKSFVSMAEKENLLPEGMEPSEYRRQFEASYPFLPDVIDILYHRWGSFPNFQRTRGVLRLLSLVVHSLVTSNLPYISLGDVNLANQDLRQDLLRHIGPEFDSVIASDITSSNAGARKVDASLGDSYKGLKIGSRSATTIFMYSFSGGTEHGAAPTEIKRSATTLSNPSSLIADALDKLKQTLFYLQYDGLKYMFSNRPNLNRVLQTKMENVDPRDIAGLESELLNRALKGGKLKSQLLLSKRVDDVSDGPEMKLIVMNERDDRVIREIMERKGSTPRVYRNTLFFLTPIETEKPAFHHALVAALAWRGIQKDQHLALTDQDKAQVNTKIKEAEKSMHEMLRRCYRQILVPSRDGLRALDLGIAVYGETKALDDEVYEKLRSENELMEKVAPLVIKAKYLSGSEDYVFTEQLYQSTLRTPGEMRTVGRDAWESAIKEGVGAGLFGLGEMEGDKPVCRYFKQSPTVAFSGGEVLIKADLCRVEPAKESAPPDEIAPGSDFPLTASPHAPDVMSDLAKPQEQRTSRIKLRFILPKGKASNLLGVINFIQTNFGELRVELHAQDGGMSQQDYEDKVLEAFRQMGVEVEVGE